MYKMDPYKTENYQNKTKQHKKIVKNVPKF